MMRGSLARVATQAVKGVQRQQTRKMGAGPPGGYWSEGTQAEGHVNGVLFNETPPPPGMKRKWEDWEAPWYAALSAAGVILFFGLNAQPNTSGVGWAREQAKERLAAKEA